MLELPEIVVLSQQMNQELIGNEVECVEIFQLKNLNIPIDEFIEKIMSCRILSVKGRGKWLFLELSGEQFLLINLGMGGDLIHFSPGDTLPEK